MLAWDVVAAGARLDQQTQLPILSHSKLPWYILPIVYWSEQTGTGGTTLGSPISARQQLNHGMARGMVIVLSMPNAHI